MSAQQIRVRRGTDAQRQGVTLAEGEPAFTTDTKQLYVGDGATPGGLPPGASVEAAVDETTVIAVGDLLWLDTDDAKPAGDQEDQGTELANQAEFATNFLGVALQASAGDEDDPIRVATAGVFEFDCAEDTYELGDLVGPIENGEGTQLVQVLAKVQSAQHAIGRVAARVPVAAERVRVAILSTVMAGGVVGTTGGGA